jgi:hypothetical protein
MALNTVNAYALAESTFGSDPSTNGSLYLAGQIFGTPHPAHEKKLEPTNYAVGRNRNTAASAGVDGSSIPVEMPLIGLSAAATDASPTPATTDFLDTFLNACFGNGTVNGEGIAPAGTTTSVILDTDVASVEDLLCVNFSNRSEWRSITVDAGTGTYTVTPALTAAPDATRDAFGYRYWTGAEDPSGPTFSYFTTIGGTGYRLSGCRPGSAKLELEAGKTGKWSFALKADSKTQESKASLPAISQFTTPQVVGTLGAFYWGTTLYPAKKVTIEWMLDTIEIGSFGGTNGRGDIKVTTNRPKITIDPGFDTQLETDMSNATERSVLLQLGSGALAGGRANTWAFFAQAAQIMKIGIVADGRYLRHGLELQVNDAGIRTGTTAYRYWTLARA